MRQGGPPWTREQELAVLHAKLEYGDHLTKQHPAAVQLAKAMNRMPAAIVMRKCNLDSWTRR